MLTYWSLNEVARDIEAPFLYPPNDLSLPLLQHGFNQRLLAAATAAQAHLEVNELRRQDGGS